MSDNWYIVDTSGDTQGPMNEESLIRLYLNESIHSKTYIWNGLTVKQWTPIINVKYINEKIKHHYIRHYQNPVINQNHAAADPEPISTQNTEKEDKHISTPTSSITQSCAKYSDDESHDELTTEECISAPTTNNQIDNNETTQNQQKTYHDEQKLQDKKVPKYPTSLEFLKHNRCVI